MEKSPKPRKSQLKPSTAKRSSVGKTEEATIEERLAALHRLQRLFENRKVDFDEWLRIIREGRR
jgi:hypothetical protein